MAPSSGSEDDEERQRRNNAAAYNASIYLMVGMPYVLLTVVGLLIYRGVKKNTEYFRAHALSVDPDAAPDGNPERG